MNILRQYITGFVLSVVLTLAAYALLQVHIDMHHTTPSHAVLTVAFVALALLQLVVQLLFFLHVGRKGSSSNIGILAFAAVIVCILVGGSLWIMSNLQQNMQPQTFINGVVNVQNEND